MRAQVSPDWWKTLFDEVYLVTDARSVCNEELTRREVDLVCRLLPIGADDKLLDLCGGHGRHSFELWALADSPDARWSTIRSICCNMPGPGLPGAPPA